MSDVFVLPMSPAQQRLWFLDQMDPGTTMFNIPAAFRLYGELDAAAIERILTTLVERHEVLRTTLTSVDGEPVQAIHPAGPVAVPVSDLSALPADVRGAALLRELRAAAAHPFDLANGPLFRPALWRLGTTDHALMLGMHHAISDGWSIGVMAREFAELWTAEREQRAPRLPDLPIQYADYAHWHRSRMLSGELEGQRNYWLEQLRGHRGILRLPTDRPRPASQTFNAGAYEFRLSERTVDHVRAFCKETGVTLFMSCISAYAAVLARYSGQHDLLVGIPAAGRTQAELEPLIGFFVNALVLRFRIDPTASVRDLVSHARATVLEAFSNQDYSLDGLMESLQFDRDPAYEPLVQATFALQNFASGPQGLPGLDVEGIQVECMHTRYDLMLLLTETPEGLSGNMIYNSDLFDQATIARMMLHLERMLEGMCQAPEASLASLPLVTQAELFEALALPTAEYEQVLPLGPMQRDIYMDTLANPASIQNSVGLSFAVDEPIDVAAWREAAQALADTQPIMRTRMRPSSAPYLEQAYQCVLRRETVDVEVVDLPANASAEETQQAVAAIIHRPYDPHGALARHFLIRVAGGQTIAGFANHHMLLDGIATTQAAAWVAAEYTRRRGGALVPESLAPTLFHEWLPQQRAEADTARVLAHWREAMAGVTPLICPTFAKATADKPAEGRPGTPVTRELVMPPELWAEVRKFCRQQRITPQILMKCAFAMVADAHGRADGDLLMQEFLAGRPPGHASALGCYYQGLPFVVPRRLLGRESTVKDLFEHARVAQKASGDYAGISIFEQRRLAPAGRVSLLFNFITAKLTMPVGNEVAEVVRSTPYAEGFLQFEITVVGDRVLMNATYDPGIFAERGFLERIEGVVRQLVNGVDRVADLSMQLPGEAAFTEATEPLIYQSIPEVIAAQAALTPHAPAVVQGSETLTYEALLGEATRIAQVLHADGIGPGDLVGVCLERSPRMLVAMLAVLQTGAAYVPMDAAYPDGRLRHMASDAKCRVILTQECLLERFAGLDCRLLALDAPDRRGGTSLSAVALAKVEVPPAPPARPARPALPARGPGSTFYVLYTSGSTGLPKGAAVHDLGEWNLISWYVREFGIGAADKFLIVSAFGFDLTQKNFFAALVTGGTVVLPEGADFDPDRILDTVKATGATIINCAPGAFYSLLDNPRRFADLATLRYAFLGGEPIRVSTLEAWLRNSHCRAEVVNTYGPTECTDVVSFYRLTDPLRFLDREVPLGAPVDNVRLHVLDELGRPAPPYGVGELGISGVCVGSGYWQKPEMTAERFVPGPGDAGTMYRTGDLVYRLADGVPVFIGRRDSQVKIRGLRIELGEIEVALAETTGLAEWIVLAIAETLIAFVKTEGPAPSTADLRARVGRRLPDYMIPPVVVAVATWPLSPNGKVDRDALSRLPRPDAAVATTPPRTDTERGVAAIWREVLERPSFGREESFFAIGGHSLLAARVVARIRSTFNIELPLRAVFEAPTIAAIGSHIDEVVSARDADVDPELLEALAGLSDEEVNRLLSDESV
ncbi:MAG: amino acid adenylation domain-containing protein [Acidobacteriota bacterium]|nr:amino acid adenylation domain-containing protein [Acidobacteriota bacterium]